MSDRPKITVVVDDQKDIGGPGFIICRDSYTAILVLVELSEHIEALWLDFDLGDKSESGAEILEWLFAIHLEPPRIRIISQNSVGTTELMAILKDNGYVPADKNTSDTFFDYWIPVGHE